MGTDKSMTRVSVFDKITGSTRHTADLKPQGLLVAKVIRSAIANDVIKGFNLEEARKVPGVVKTITCFDVSDIRFPTPGHLRSVETVHQDIADRRLPNTRVRAYGGGIAAVTAKGGIAAARTARLVKVEYKEYAPLLTVEDAMTEGAPRLHDEELGNAIAHSSFVAGGGTYGEAVKEGGLVEVEKDYRTQNVQCCHIETPILFAYMEKGGIIIATSTQIPHIVRRVISQALGLPMGRIRVIKPYIGGRFGNKQDVLYEPLNALLTTQVEGRGVRMGISREETPGCTRVRHAIEFKVKATARKDGTLIARKLETYSNQGGYVSHAHIIVASSSNEPKQIYKGEKVLESDAQTVYINLATGGTMRGYGVPQVAFAMECMVDNLAPVLHMDPLESRKENCTRPGYIDPHTHVRCNIYGPAECMEKGRGFIRWDERRRGYENQTEPVRKGIGITIFCCKTDVYPISLEAAPCRMILNQDGSMQLQMGTTEIGQSADTVFTQMTIEVTGIAEDKVNVLSIQDTDVSLFDTGAYASRQTYVSDMAMKKTGAILKEKILDYAAYVLEKPQDTLDVRDNHIVDKETRTQLPPMEELTTTAFYSLDRSVHITVEATSHRRTNTFVTGACFAEVGVDMPLGKVKVTNIVNAHDSRKLINPKLAAAQVHDDVSMGLDCGFSEGLLFDARGKPLNDNLLDYKLPIAMDIPDLNVLFVELDDPIGPFGNRALGEPPVISVASIVRSTVSNATGVAVDSLLMDPQKMMKHFEEAGLIQKGW